MSKPTYKDILAEAPNFFEAYQSGYTYEKRAGALNLAYICGAVNNKLRARGAASITSDTGYAPLYENQAVRGIINYGVNILIDPFRNILTTMVQNTPGYEVYPAVEDDDKKIVADKATQILKYHDEKIFDLKSKLGELYTWATGPVGTAYLELLPEDTDVLFPVAGTEEDKNIAKDGKAIDQFGRPVEAQVKKRKQKRLQARVKTIWDVAHSEDSPDGLIDGSTIQVGWSAVTIRELRKWAKADDAEKVARGLPMKTSVIEDPKTEEVRTAKGLSGRGRASILTGEDRQVKLYHVFHKPDDDYPDGWYGIVDKQGNELFFIPRLPIAGIMPYTQLNTNNLDAGECIKRSVFDDCRGPQVLYQGIFDSRAVHSMLAANPPMQRFQMVSTSSDKKNPVYIYPKQGETEVIAFDGYLAEAVKANPALANALKPRPMEITGLNSDVKDLLEECKQAVLNATGQNLANVGQFPNANISGASVQEQVSVDALGQLPMISLLNDFWGRFRTKVLRAVRAYYTTEQIAFMLNDETISDAEKFKIEDIDDSYDVRICSTDGLPQTPQGKIQFYTQVMQIAPTPEEKYEAWLKVREIIGQYGLIDEGEDIEEELAEIENKVILEDDSLLTDMKVPVPAVDSLGQPVYDAMGQQVMESKARQRVRSWANRFQNRARHAKVHRPLLVGPEMMRNGPEKTQLVAWHVEREEELYALQTISPTQGGQDGELSEAGVQAGAQSKNPMQSPVPSQAPIPAGAGV